jgi:WD40 repeat protein
MDGKSNVQLRIGWEGSLAPREPEITPQPDRIRHRLNPANRYLRVRSVNVTRNGRFLIISFEQTPQIRVVDLEKLAYLPNRYEGHTQTVRLTSATPDSKAFFTASWDGTYRKFDLATGKCLQILSGLARSPTCFLSPDEKYLFTASYDSDYNLESKNAGWCWDLHTGKMIHSYEHNSDRLVHEAIDIACDEGGVYTGSDDGRAYRWPFSGGRPLVEYFSCEGTVRKLAVSRNLLAAACTDGTVRVHEKISGKQVYHFTHPESDLREVRIANDEKRLWCAGGNGFVYCYNLQDGELLYNKWIHRSWIWSICLTGDERILVTGGGDGIVFFLASDTGRILAALYNLREEDFLMTCPPDKAFPSGIFYTSCKKNIQVLLKDQAADSQVVLDETDPRYTSYFDRHNLKNLIRTRLKNNSHYNQLTDSYLKNRRLLVESKQGNDTKMLKA